MSFSLARLLAGIAAVALVVVGCGSAEVSVGDDAASTAETVADADEGDGDHGDEGDEDEDHADEGDEDHADEADHADEGDEDHADEGDDDHADEGDEDHADEGHDDDAGGLGAHEHGTAELSVAWIDSDVVIDLISPTQNVFGFEYEPESDEDLATASDRTAAITATGVITINDEAGCELAEPASTAIEQEASHSEMTVSWAFSCANPDDIAEVDLSGLFGEFPGFEDVDVEWVSASSQSSAELSPENPTLRLDP